MKRFGLGFIHCLLAGAWCAAAAALASEFDPHRALYDLTLIQARPGSGISGVTGRMAVEWNNSCTGWAFQYRSVIDVDFDETDPVQLTSNATSWESSDGRDYRFDVRHLTNGKEMEHIEGVAKVTGKDGSGQTIFNHPAPKKVDLPAGTLFPVAHSLAIIRRAKEGKVPQFLARNIFDGMDVTGLYQVNAVIGAVRPDRKGKPPGTDESLKDVSSWSVSLAYFALGSSKSAPDHEISMRLFANGVADDLVMDFEEFSVRARLSQLQMLASPSCQ